jgi:hypothetical protein
MRGLHALALFIGCSLLSSCGLFSAKPPLPKQASIAASESNRVDQFAMAVRQADIIYFPLEAVDDDSNEEPAGKILEAFRRNTKSFSIAWQGIETDQQTILDQIAEKQDHIEDFLNQLRWSYSRQTREKCRAILRANAGIQQLALGCPRVVKAKLQSGEALSGEEEASVPRGYRAPIGDLEDFAEQLAAMKGLHEREIAHLYRAHLFAEQFAAEKIVTFMRQREGVKLLVFLRRRDFVGSGGLPYFVAQKLKLRQIRFDSDQSFGRARPRLLTSLRTGDGTFGWL